MGDFTGFSFNGVHTSELGITRVSGGDRYEDELLPDFDDATTDIPGGDGSYYFGSYYKKKNFDLDIAFDHLTEEQYRNIKRLFGTRKPGKLIFDETPYKYYNVKIENVPSLDTVCFDEEIKEIEGRNLGVAERLSAYDDEDTHDEFLYPSSELLDDEEDSRQSGSNSGSDSGGGRLLQERQIRRIYKGEGEIKFVAYDPFAHSVYKDSDSYREDYSNVDEWVEAAGLLTAAELLDYDSYEDDSFTIKVYNPGDIDVSFSLYIPFNGTTISAFNFTLEEKDEDASDDYTAVNNYAMHINEITRKGDVDTGVIINSKNHLIEGVVKTTSGNDVSYSTTGSIYNDYIAGGDFFTIPCTAMLMPEFGSHFDGQIKFSIDTGEDTAIMYEYIYY